MAEPDDFSLDLSFINDDHLRKLAEDYWIQGKSSFEAAAYLGAIVAWGGVLEGILAWALLSRKAAQVKARYPTEPIEGWVLSRLIKIAKEFQLIGPGADQAAWAVNNFRNFIHPYKLLREPNSSRADRVLALNVLTAVQEITRSLRGRLADTPTVG